MPKKNLPGIGSKEWSIPEIINEFYSVETREIEPRDYIYASEIGMPFRDRYYSMLGIKPTEIVGPRARRIFQEGYAREISVVNIMRDIGLLSDAQTVIELPEDKEHLRVSGRADLLVDGEIDFSKRVKELESEIKKLRKISDSKHSNKLQRYQAALSVVKGLGGLATPLKPYVCEIKSVNSKAFWRSKNNLRGAYIHHSLQLLTYLKAFALQGSKFTSGKVLYVSRDDAWMEEVPVILDDAVLNEIWERDVTAITEAYREKKPPECEPWIIKGDWGWAINWKLKYSNYLAKITGCADLKEYELICDNLKKLQREFEGRAPAKKRGRKTNTQRIKNQFDKLL